MAVVKESIREVEFRPMPGWLPLFVILFMIIGMPLTGGILAGSGNPLLGGVIGVFSIVTVPGGLICLKGFAAVQPNTARVLTLFGNYKGSIKRSGFFWMNPFFSKRKISLRVRNFETGSEMKPGRTNEMGKFVKDQGRTAGKPSKVNDKDGNPIEISAVVVWRVVDTAEAVFEVDDYDDYVTVQSESALRVLASRHPYDNADDEETSLRSNIEAVSGTLKSDIQERLDTAGVEVVEARISHLAYAPEIAGAMLQRQQAQAVVAARARIVDGAVGMVEMALKRLSEEQVLNLDEERKAAMVSNLLVVLCSGSHTQPVVNTGTLYQ